MRRLPRLVSLVGPAAVALVVLGGCGMLDGDSSSDTSTAEDAPAEDAQRDEASGEVTEAADAAVESIKVGDCLDLSESAAIMVSDLPVVPCGEPHDSEAYASFDLTGDTYPTDIDDQATVYCESEFATFVGTSYEESSLGYTYLSPSGGSWSQGDHEVLCIVWTDGDPVTTTFQGSGL